MRREEYTSSIATGNLNSSYPEKNSSFVDQFIGWFRNFLENAE